MVHGLVRTSLVVSLAAAALLAQQQKHDWAQWRGPNATGVAVDADPPTKWSEKENIRFKLELPGVGYGTPVIVGNRIYLTTAIEVGAKVVAVPDNAPGAHDNAKVTRRHAFVALAIDRQKGKIVWQKKLHEQLPHAGFHNSSALASASVVTDGELILAYFGSYGLYCLDKDGELKWQKDFGDMQIKHGHGEGCTPVLHGDTVVVNWDHEGQSFIVALNKRTGEQIWRKDRDEVTSWATPLVVEVDGKQQLIVSGTKQIRAYDLKNGEVIWSCRGLSNNVVASPVSSNGMLYAGSSYVKKRMLAVRLAGATGDITKSDHVVWRRSARTPYVPSPLLYGDWLYFLNHYQGFLARVHAKTGEEPSRPLRLPGMREIYASPVGAAGRIYITDRQGATLVISHSNDKGKDKPQLLAHNLLEDSFSASAAIVGSEIYLRGMRYLYCIAKPVKKQ
ncbi:MAG: outer membrane protein assembly factor BamB [Planctomycetota bacterium]|jgi:outer membrane protein assembly factor BamB